MKAIKFILGALYGLICGAISLPFDVVDLIKDQYFASDRYPVFSFANPMNLIRVVAGTAYIAFRNLLWVTVSDACKAADINTDIASRAVVPYKPEPSFLQNHFIKIAGMPSMLVSYPKQAAIIAQESVATNKPKEFKLWHMLSVSNNVLLGTPTIPSEYRA